MIQLNRVEATGGFFLLLAWLNYIDRAFLVPMTLIACALHELGHVAAIRLLGGSVKGVRLTAIGAELVLAYPLGYWQEGLSALAGPGVNLLLALAFCTIPRAAGRRPGGVLYSGPSGRTGSGGPDQEVPGLLEHCRNDDGRTFFDHLQGEYHTAADSFLADGRCSAPKKIWFSQK